MNRSLKYTAYTAFADGRTFDYVGTVEGATNEAVAYARRAFTQHTYGQAKPVIVVTDAVNGERLVKREA